MSESLSVDNGPAIEKKHRLRRIAAYTRPGGKDPRELTWRDYGDTEELVAIRRQQHCFGAHMNPRQENKRDGEREFKTLFFDKAPTMDDIIEVMIREAETSSNALAPRIQQLKALCDAMDEAENLRPKAPIPEEVDSAAFPKNMADGAVTKTMQLPRRPRTRKVNKG